MSDAARTSPKSVLATRPVVCTGDGAAEAVASAGKGHSWFFPGYAKGASLLAIGMAISICLLGLTMPYYNKAASDMVSVYEALLANSDLPPDFLVYPGVIGRVLLGWWLSAMDAIGFVTVSRLEDLQGVSTTLKPYEAVWQKLVEAGRVFSLGIGMICAVTFIALVRQWLDSAKIAVLAGVALAFSSGYALAFRILRPEMMTASLIFSALLVLFLAARDASLWRFAKLALAGFLVALAIVEKVQSIIPAITLLPLALAFGTRADDGQNREISRENANPIVFVTMLALAFIALLPAYRILSQGFANMAIVPDVVYKPLTGGLSGVYQWLTAGVIGVFMVAYAVIWRVPPVIAVCAIAAIGFGLGLGFDVLYLQSSMAAVAAVANPIEHLQAHSAGLGASLLSQDPDAILINLLKAAGKSLAIHTFILSPTHRPTLIVEWLAWAGAYHAYRSGRLLLAAQIALLIGSAIAQDAIFSLRQVKVYYLPYSDPPIILAGALALSQFKHRLMVPQFQKAAAVIMTVYIIWGHAQPALAVYSRHDRGKVCGIVTLFTKRIKFPYCGDEPGQERNLKQNFDRL